MKSVLLCSSLMLLLASCSSAPKKEANPPPSSLPAPSPGGPVARVTTAPELAITTPTVDSSGRVTTASGLQYRVMASGPADGVSPTFFDTVLVHYRGTLTDGTVFDSSVERGVPASFGVGQVIPGWTEALKLMKPGDQWVLYIPSRLAYGSRAVGDKIPPNSDLIFQVALIQVVGR